jgi:predicted SnoaL-like aldol condensation-catalyzing enzyme
VIAFYSRAFNDHEPADAVAKYVGSEYIQHNPDTPSGADAFIQSARGFIAKFPQVSVEIKRGADIFRLRNGKIVEHWDVRQPVPEIAANDNTMF